MIESAKMDKAASDIVPLSKRPGDIVILVFIWINLIFIAYMVDVEQLVIANPDNFKYPLWPPAWVIDLTHWWGRNFDPVLIARPAWWKMTIWMILSFSGLSTSSPFTRCIRGLNRPGQVTSAVNIEP